MPVDSYVTIFLLFWPSAKKAGDGKNYQNFPEVPSDKMCIHSSVATGNTALLDYKRC